MFINEKCVYILNILIYTQIYANYFLFYASHDSHTNYYVVEVSKKLTQYLEQFHFLFLCSLLRLQLGCG